MGQSPSFFRTMAAANKAGKVALKPEDRAAVFGAPRPYDQVLALFHGVPSGARCCARGTAADSADHRFCRER
jgi:hypothetical protein